MSAGLEIVVAKVVLGHVAKLAATQALPEDKVRRFLGRDPQRLAMQAALRAAFGDFKREHPQYAAAFFDEAFLTSDRVAPILAACLTSAGEPDAVALAAAWGRQLPGRGGGPLRRRGEREFPPARRFAVHQPWACASPGLSVCVDRPRRIAAHAL